MNIAIRADASVTIGSGHVMRCLALADELRALGARLSFICLVDKGNLIGLIERRGYQVHRLPAAGKLFAGQKSDRACKSISMELEAERMGDIFAGGNADLLIVDHYSLDLEWEQRLRPRVKALMVIDDLPDRMHDCDILLDQNFCRDFLNRYEGKVPKSCRQLLGPKYALLRPEFRKARKAVREWSDGVRSVLVFLGSSDPTNHTARILSAFRFLDGFPCEIEVVVGSSNPHKEEIKDMCRKMRGARYHCQVDNMAQLMMKADLAVGAGGSTVWERCCLGQPSLITILSDNQYESTVAVAGVGAAINMGWAHTVSPEDYAKMIRELDASDLARMSSRGMELVDGEGSIRAAREIMSLLN